MFNRDKIRNKSFNTTRQNFALDGRTVKCLNVSGIQRQIIKHVKILSERSKKTKNKRRTKRASLLGNPLTIHKIQFGLVMIFFAFKFKYILNCYDMNL